MLALYLDEDSMDQSLVAALRARGVDVITATEAGMLGRSDSEQLDYATGQGRMLYTFNRGDFYRLHTQYLTEGKSHQAEVLNRLTKLNIREYSNSIYPEFNLKKLVCQTNARNFFPIS